MSNGPIHSNRDDTQDVDPGEPIAVLAGFEHDVRAGFFERIRRAIGRRTSAAHITLFIFDMPAAVLKEFWLIVMGLFDPGKSRKDAER